jgi:uncharacterized protein (TIGR02996 family)
MDDVLLQHEAFLRAIFDSPDDYTNRLVYADFLEEQGLSRRAEAIRVSCELARLPADADPERRKNLDEYDSWLARIIVPWDRNPTASALANRGLWQSSGAGREGIGVTTDHLEDPLKFRDFVVHVSPAWYGQTKLYVRYESKLAAAHVDALFSLPFTPQVREWNLAGWIDEQVRSIDDEAGDPTIRLTDVVQLPAITGSGVEALAKHRGARRIETLDVRNNNLDNDAARALVASPYLTSLKKLYLLEGNRLRGRVWQQVIERFGEDVAE